MATPAKKTLMGRRNAPFEWKFQVMDGLTPINITGYAFSMQLREYGAQAGTALVDLGMTTTVNAKGIRIADAAEGRIHIVIPETDINGLPGVHQPSANSEQSFPFDLRVSPPSGLASVWIEGLFIVQPGVSKP